jgi:hypothetical protein
MTRSHARAALLGILLIGPPTAAAQSHWAIGAGIGAPRFSGGATELATGRSLLPYRPTLLEVGFDRAGHRVGVGVWFHYASSSIALEGSDGLAAIKDALTVYGAEPFVALRLTHLGPEGVLRLLTGPLLEVWKVHDVDSRTRIGVAAAMELAVPFGGRWSGVARAGAAVTPSSPFTEADLDVGLEPRALWRREVAATLRYRL